MNSKARAAYEADVALNPYYHDGSPRKSWDELDEIAQISWGRPAPPPDDLQREPPADDDYWFPKYEALSKKCGDLRARITALESREARLVAALDTALAGGNDIANMLIDRLGHDFASRFPPDLAPEHSEIGFSDTYALWCVWRAMMIARAELDAVKGGGDDG